MTKRTLTTRSCFDPAPARGLRSPSYCETFASTASKIEELVAKANDRWGYEDPVYRFYHHSFKVYSLQKQTEAMVDLLRKLSPERQLNSCFVEIVAAGTEKEFRLEDNKRWTAMTRPILEAFFHARFFLEMALRYRSLREPPDTLPSGYAALLSLYDLR